MQYFSSLQKKIQNVSPVKKRILQYVRVKNISMRDFYKRTGISRGTLENTSGITEDTLAKIFATNPDLSPLWVITGDGPMMQNNKAKTGMDQSSEFVHSNNSEELPTTMESAVHLLIKEKNKIIKELKQRIQEQKKVIFHLINQKSAD